MGVVLKQSFKNTISTYLGFGIGAVNTLFLYTNFLTDDYYGLVAFLLSAANIMMPFMAFGVHNAIVKYYSSFKTKTSINSFLTFFLIVLALLLLGVILSWVNREEKQGKRNAIKEETVLLTYRRLLVAITHRPCGAMDSASDF